MKRMRKREGKTTGKGVGTDKEQEKKERVTEGNEGREIKENKGRRREERKAWTC